MSTFSGLLLVPDDFQFPSWKENPHFKPSILPGGLQSVLGQAYGLDESYQHDSNQIFILSKIHKRIRKGGYVIGVEGPKKLSEVSHPDHIFRVFSYEGGIIKKDLSTLDQDQLCLEIVVHE